MRVSPEEIADTWEIFDDDDISTEKLMAMVCDTLGIDVDDVMDGLMRAGKLG